MDVDVAFSTISINIQEVVEYTKEVKTTTFFERIGTAITDSWNTFLSFIEGCLTFFIFAVPYLIIIVLIIVIVVKANRKRNNKTASKKKVEVEEISPAENVSAGKDKNN